MIYSIHTSPAHAVEAALGVKDPITGEYKMPQFITEDKAISDWRYFTNYSSFSGSTETVAKEFYGDHSYESKITASIERNILTNEYFQSKFQFHSRQRTGQMVDIPRYLAGDPRHWFSMRRTNVKRMSIRVFAPMGGVHDVTKKDMEVCGALTCASVEVLESNGIGVELWASCVSERCRYGSKNADICTLIKLKDVGQYTDYGMINYITGNSWFYRNIVFKDRIISACRNGGQYRNVGGSVNFRRDLIPQEDGYDIDLDVVIPRIYNINVAKSWIENELIKSCEKAVGNEEAA